MVNLTVDDVKGMEDKLTDAGSYIRGLISVGDDTSDLFQAEELIMTVRDALHDTYCGGCD